MDYLLKKQDTRSRDKDILSGIKKATNAQHPVFVPAAGCRMPTDTTELKT